MTSYPPEIVERVARALASMNNENPDAIIEWDDGTTTVSWTLHWDEALWSLATTEFLRSEAEQREARLRAGYEATAAKFERYASPLSSAYQPGSMTMSEVFLECARHVREAVAALAVEPGKEGA